MLEVAVNIMVGRASLLAEGICAVYLYMAAVASLSCNKKLKVFYNRLIDNHKPAKVALVAVMRKLLSFMHVLVKKYYLVLFIKIFNSLLDSCYGFWRYKTILFFMLIQLKLL
jgi:hypothetical protein